MQAYCLAKPGAWPDNPWDHEHPVIKVGEGERGKIFAFLGATGVGVKGGPTPRGGRRVAPPLSRRRERDGLHRPLRLERPRLRRRHRGRRDLLEAVDESYRLVVAKLPKKHRPEGWDA